MSLEERWARALTRISAATGVSRSRATDRAAASRDGTPREMRLEAAVIHLESAADVLWAELAPEAGASSDGLREAA